MKKFTPRDIAVVAGGSVLFFLLGRFASIPTPVPTIDICMQYGILAVIAVVCGPTVGAMVGFLGHLAMDLSLGVHWWSWIVASSAFGALAGVLGNVTRMASARLDKRTVINFNAIQIAVHVVCWAGIAPVLDIWWYGEPMDKLFDQGLMAAGANAVTTAVVGTALLAAYFNLRDKNACKK